VSQFREQSKRRDKGNIGKDKEPGTKKAGRQISLARPVPQSPARFSFDAREPETTSSSSRQTRHQSATSELFSDNLVSQRTPSNTYWFAHSPKAQQSEATRTNKGLKRKTAHLGNATSGSGAVREASTVERPSPQIVRHTLTSKTSPAVPLPPTCLLACFLCLHAGMHKRRRQTE
jgi:hypothetical protein